MSRKNEPLEVPEDDESNFVPVVFVLSPDEAERFRQLLDDHDIPAVVATDNEIADSEDSGSRLGPLAGKAQGTAVLVPAVLLDDAGRVIADFEDTERFQAADDELGEDEEGDEDEFGLIEETGE